MKWKKIIAAALALAVSFGAVQTANSYTPQRFSAAYAAGEMQIVTIDNINYAVYGDYATIYTIPDVELAEELVLPATINGVPLEYIPTRAFQGHTEITSVTLPDTVRSIGSGAFIGCTSLRSINMPKDLVSIDDNAFGGCSKLESIDIPEGCGVQRAAFEGCSSLTSVRLPSDIQYIHPFTFMGCSSLKSIKLPDEMEMISESAFEGCSSLEEINLSGVKFLGIRSFAGCSGLESIKIGYLSMGSVSVAKYAFANCTGLKNVEIGYKLSKLPEGCFQGCTGLERVDVPGGIWTIGKDAFCGCEKLGSISIMGRECTIYDAPSTISNLHTETKVKENDAEKIVVDDSFSGTIRGYEDSTAQAYAEKYNYNFVPIETTTQPLITTTTTYQPENTTTTTVTTVIDGITYGIDGNQGKIISADSTVKGDVVLPDRVDELPVMYICQDAFKGNAGITSVTAPRFLYKIEKSAFKNCPKLKKAVLSENTEWIEYEAFADCTSLDEIVVYDADIDYSPETICNASQGGTDGDQCIFNGTIYGYKDSPGALYAEQKGYKFEEIVTTTAVKTYTTTTNTYGTTTTTTTTTTSDDEATTVTTTANTKDFYFSIIDADGKSDGKAKPGEVLQFSLIVDAGNNTCAGIDAQYDLGGLELVQMGKKAEALGGASLTSNPETARFSVMSVSDTTGEPTAVTNGESVSIIKVRVPEDAKNGDYFLISLVADQLHVFKEGGTGDKYTTGITGYGLTVYTDNPVTTITTTVPSVPGGTTSTAPQVGVTTTKAPAVPGTTSVPVVVLTTTSTTASAANPVTTTKPVTAEKALGDFTGDGKIDAVDASNILAKYAATSTGGAAPTADELAAGDVNKDGKIDAVDASKVLAYYAYKGSGGDKDFHEYLLS